MKNTSLAPPKRPWDCTSAWVHVSRFNDPLCISLFFAVISLSLSFLCYLSRSISLHGCELSLSVSLKLSVLTLSRSFVSPFHALSLSVSLSLPLPPPLSLLFKKQYTHCRKQNKAARAVNAHRSLQLAKRRSCVEALSISQRSTSISMTAWKRSVCVVESSVSRSPLT